MSSHRDRAIPAHVGAGYVGDDDRALKRPQTRSVAPKDNGRCEHCPGRTPFRPDPETIQRAQNEHYFQPPLDEGIREIVLTLVANGVETFESCEGGTGHSFPEATVRFEGTDSEGLRAASVALENGLPVRRLRRVWGIQANVLHGPWWEMTFRSPKESHRRAQARKHRP
jgi:hypothetical protein